MIRMTLRVRTAIAAKCACLVVVAVSLACCGPSRNTEKHKSVCFLGSAEQEALAPRPEGECNPILVPAPEPRIQSPVAIGHHPDGTWYVLDEFYEAEPRVFMSPSPGETRLRRIEADRIYAAVGPDGMDFNVIMLPTIGAHLYLERPSGAAATRRGHIDPTQSRMAVLSDLELVPAGMEAQEHFDAAVELEMHDECQVSELAFERYDLFASARYAAVGAEGHKLLVAWLTASSFSRIYVFFGDQSPIRERKPVGYSSLRNGSFTLEFEADGQQLRAAGPGLQVCAESGDCSITVASPDEILNLDRVNFFDSGMKDERFYCTGEGLDVLK